MFLGVRYLESHFNDELERIRVQCAYTLRAQWFPTRLRYVIQI